MNHSCYENVGSSKQTSHSTPVLHIQRQQRQHTKATRVITVLFTVATSLHRDVWMLVSTWFASGTYQSSFASLVRGNVYFLTVTTFVSKVQRSLFFSAPYPNSRRSTILEFLSEPKGQLFCMSFQFLRGYAFLLWFRVCAWFLSRSFPGM